MEGRKFFRECPTLGSCQLRLTMVSSVTVDMGCFLSLPSLNAAPGSFVSQLPAPCLCLSYVACQTAPAICISPIFVSYFVEASEIWNQFPKHFQADFRKFNLPFAFPSPEHAKHKTRTRKVILEEKICFTWRKTRRDDRSSSGDIVQVQKLTVDFLCEKECSSGVRQQDWQVLLPCFLQLNCRPAWNWSWCYIQVETLFCKKYLCNKLCPCWVFLPMPAKLADACWDHLLSKIKAKPNLIKTTCKK